MSYRTSWTCDRCGVIDLNDEGADMPEGWRAIYLDDQRRSLTHGPHIVNADSTACELCPACVEEFDVWLTPQR